MRFQISGETASFWHELEVEESKKEVYVGKLIFRFPTEDNIFIHFLTVVEKQRGQGHSQKMFDLFLTWVKEKCPKVTRITLVAQELMEKYGKLVHLYETWGFATDGQTRIKYVGEVLCREVPMVLEIN